MEFKKPLRKRSLNSPLICHVCGDIARGLNFDVMTCMSCKAFFRRHALRTVKPLRCLLDNSCDINKETRGGCSACRLKKCFQLGMNPNLIRSPYKPKRLKFYISEVNIFTQINKFLSISIFYSPKPLNLLNQDCSLLTTDEWNLLSNIINAYDEQNLIVRINCYFKEQSSLPPKIRSKTINAFDVLSTYYTVMQPFIEHTPYFSNSSIDIRRVIIQNNLNGIGSFNAMLAAIEANVFDNVNYLLACYDIFGKEYVKESQRLLDRIEINKTLLKVLLMILAFSSNCSVVIYHPTINVINVSIDVTFYLLQTQSIFITMLWKYLVYQYGHVEAVRYLIRMVKNYLDVLNRIHENVSQQHCQMVDHIVEKTTYSLTLHD